EKMAELGFFGFCIDERYSGNGMGFLEGCLVIEQIAMIHTSWRMAFNMHCWEFLTRSWPLSPDSSSLRRCMIRNPYRQQISGQRRKNR
ncbi:MAG: acyl-CoA dehydrogenase family protein, partial [Syntrophales bacterium]